MMVRIFCKLGRKKRLDMPVIFLPTPPFFLANPRRLMLLPARGFFPQIAHILDIELPPK